MEFGANCVQQITARHFADGVKVTDHHIEGFCTRRIAALLGQHLIGFFCRVRVGVGEAVFLQHFAGDRGGSAAVFNEQDVTGQAGVTLDKRLDKRAKCLIAVGLVEIVGDPGFKAFTQETAVGISRDHDDRSVMIGM